jgi:hypothetical protein
VPEEFETKDSGIREGFDSGAIRDTQDGKPRYDLIPPTALRRLAMLYGRGAEKYDEHNWTKGIPVSRCMASLMRHVYQFAMGNRDEDHGAAIIFNVMCIMHYEEVGRTDMDDSFNWQTGQRRNNNESS